MKASTIPVKFPVPFASSAGGGFIRQIPLASTGQPGAASLEDGFPPECFQPLASGGVAPFGEDFNGLDNQVTAWLQWVQAGNPLVYDAAFAAAIGGYPKGALLTSLSLGNYWISTTDDNSSNPDTGGANWAPLITTITKRSLTISNDAVAPNTKRNIVATQLALEDSLGNVAKLRSVNVSISSGISGAGGLDTGSVAASTIYYEYVIAQPGGLNPAGLMSASPTAPTMPSGYTLFALVGDGAITDGSSNFYRIKKQGDLSQLIVTAATNTAALRTLGTGTLGTFKNSGMGTGDWAALSLAGKVPATAISARVVITNNFGSAAVGKGMVAPNNNYDGPTSSNPPPLYVGNQGPQTSTTMGELFLESGSIYAASDASTGTFAVLLSGWRSQF